MAEARLTRDFSGVAGMAPALRVMACSGPMMEMHLDAQTALQLARLIERASVVADGAADVAAPDSGPAVPSGSPSGLPSGSGPGRWIGRDVLHPSEAFLWSLVLALLFWLPLREAARFVAGWL